MVTIFNRVALTTIQDRAFKNRLKAALSAAFIDYRVEKLPVGCTRPPRGDEGDNPSFTYEYDIYVHKDDHSRAQKILADLE